MNLWVGMGRLTKEPELKYSQSKPDMAIARYSLAIDEGYGEKKKTTFVNITAFGKAGEFASKYFHKGQRVLVKGRLDITYDKEKDKTYVSILAENQEFADGKVEAKPQEQEETNEDILPFT